MKPKAKIDLKRSLHPVGHPFGLPSCRIAWTKNLRRESGPSKTEAAYLYTMLHRGAVFFTWGHSGKQAALHKI